MTFDLNADLGEGGANDEALLEMISSANVCTGFHAGSQELAITTIRRCFWRDVVIGAHPGLPDRENFGRREVPIVPPQLSQLLNNQVLPFCGWAAEAGAHCSYVKLHGGLYHMVGGSPELARAAAEFAQEHQLALMGQPKSCLAAAAKDLQVRYIREGFADRAYNADGTLVDRNMPNAILHDPKDAYRQLQWLLSQGIESICIHGDNPDAMVLAQFLVEHSKADGHVVRAAV